MSTVDARVRFGLGSDASPVDSVVVEWGTGGRLVRERLDPAKPHLLYREAAAEPGRPRAIVRDDDPWAKLPWAHAENAHSDFDRYPLLTEMHSAEGPALAVDAPSGLVYFGGALGQESALFALNRGGDLRRLNVEALREPERADVVAATWTDYDGDGDRDLLVVRGGDETAPAQFATRPMAYERTGALRLERAPDVLPSLTGVAAGAVCAGDFDGDGDEDVFIGAHFRLRAFAAPAPSVLLLNDGSGGFESLTSAYLDTLARVRAAATGDLDGDGRLELVVAQDYGPVSVLRLREGSLTATASEESGRWRALACVDADRDGSDEIVAGNLGLNTRFRASPANPLRLRIGDFDDNGSSDYVPTAVTGGVERSLPQLGDLWRQMPPLRSRVPRYRNYARATLSEVLDLDRERLSLSATELRTGLFAWDEDSRQLAFEPLPAVAQETSVRALLPLGGANAASPTLLLAGNYTYVKPEFGGQSSGYGVVLSYDPRAGWREGGRTATFAPGRGARARAPRRPCNRRAEQCPRPARHPAGQLPVSHERPTRSTFDFRLRDSPPDPAVRPSRCRRDVHRTDSLRGGSRRLGIGSTVLHPARFQPHGHRFSQRPQLYRGLQHLPLPKFLQRRRSGDRGRQWRQPAGCLPDGQHGSEPALPQPRRLPLRGRLQEERGRR